MSVLTDFGDDPEWGTIFVQFKFDFGRFEIDCTGPESLCPDVFGDLVEKDDLLAKVPRFIFYSFLGFLIGKPPVRFDDRLAKPSLMDEPLLCPVQILR